MRPGTPRATRCTIWNLAHRLGRADAHAAHDNKNVLIYPDTNWCKLKADGRCDPTLAASRSTGAGPDLGDRQHQDRRVSATSTSRSTPSTSVGPTWSRIPSSPTIRSIEDLQNALTHEVGHLIGLDHTCYIPSSLVPRPVDNTGNPLVYCTTRTPRSAPRPCSRRPSRATSRSGRSAPDDQQALCEIYPVENEPDEVRADRRRHQRRVPVLRRRDARPKWVPGTRAARGGSARAHADAGAGGGARPHTPTQASRLTCAPARP